MATVRLFVTGETETGPDPLMTTRGCDDVRQNQDYLKDFFIPRKSFIYAGTGKRHQQMAEVLGLAAPDVDVEVFGKPDNVEVSDDTEVVVKADGTMVPLADYPPLDPRLALAELCDTSDKDVVFCSPQFILALGEPTAALGSVWEAEHDGEDLNSLEQLT